MIFNTNSTAESTSYNNSQSELTSKNVQGALDEVATKIIFDTVEPETVEAGKIVMVYE